MHDEQTLYRCSCKSVDDIVDTVNAIDGVYGAQICGAGMGGCVAIFTKKGINMKPYLNKYKLVTIINP
jgi:galactokinase